MNLVSGAVILPLLALSAGTISSVAIAAPQNAAISIEQTTRERLSLDQGWRFHFGQADELAARPDFDDRTWETVSTPHSWNRIGAYGTKRGVTLNNEQGIGWYRLSLNAAPANAGQRQYLDFGAVSKVADVWVNGLHVARHAGAFARFRIDVTDVWQAGKRNVIAVRADNSKPELGKPTGETIPLSGDFFVHGGIYRPVSLITTGEAGIDLLDHGGPGVYARSENVTAKSADIRVLTRLRNQGKRTQRLDLVLTIRDAAGQQVAQSRARLALKPGASQKEAVMALANPHLWNGRSDPYLYSVTAQVLDNGKTIDAVTQPLGIRTFRFDANAGFFLNEAHVKLHGVSRHQDEIGKGWALTAADHARDMDLISEIGANTVRQAHYQHADEWSDAADLAGMVVWAELPYVTTPGLAGGKGSPELWANAEEQLREQIRQNWNHPSIMMWSVGNEVDSAKGFGANQTAQPLALLQRLNALAKQEDPTRPTTFADCCEDLGLVQTAGEKLAGTADLIGYNRYYGWYYPKPLEAAAQFGAQMEKLHRKHPTLPMSISEYGAGGAVTQHSDNVRTGYLNFTGRPQPEEFETFVHEQNWPVIRDRDFLFASWVWAMFDFGSDLRGEGDSVDLNTKGLVTADRKTRKDAFWYYKAQWSSEPGIYLAGKHYRERAYPMMDVTAFSSTDRASLTLNGKLIGEVACPERVCVWPNVALRPGANEAAVSAQSFGKSVTDVATWIGPDAKSIRIEVGDLAGHEVAGHRFGSDNFVSGGTPMVLNRGGFAGRNLTPPRTVIAAQPELYDYWREGTAFSYAVPVPNGSWNVTVHTFEPRPDAGDDVLMSVKTNGATVVSPFSVKKAAGGALKGVARTFRVKVKDGTLKLDFTGQNGPAVLAALEVTR